MGPIIPLLLCIAVLSVITEHKQLTFNEMHSKTKYLFVKSVEKRTKISSELPTGDAGDFQGPPKSAGTNGECMN